MWSCTGRCRSSPWARFSATVSEGKMRASWKERPSPERAGRAGAAPAGEEDRAHQVLTVAQRVRGALEADLSLLHEVRPRGELHRDLERLLDEDHGGSPPMELADLLEELGDDDRGEAEGELVDDEQPRLGHERHREREHLLLAAAEVAGTLPDPLA